MGKIKLDTTFPFPFTKIISKSYKDILTAWSETNTLGKLLIIGMETPATCDTRYLGGRQWLPRQWPPDTGYL